MREDAYVVKGARRVSRTEFLLGEHKRTTRAIHVAPPQPKDDLWPLSFQMQPQHVLGS